MPGAEAHSGATISKLLEAALALLPPGRAFTRRALAMVPRVVEALMVEFARVHREAEDVLAHISPRRARREDFLRKWEEAAGTTAIGTSEERAQRVADAIRAGNRAATLADYQAAATVLGLSITGQVWTDPLFEAGVSGAGDPVRADSWRYALTFPVAGSEALWPELAEAWEGLKRAHTLVWPGYAQDREQVVDSAGNPVIDSAGNKVVV